jgi:hypothetical protein
MACHPVVHHGLQFHPTAPAPFHTAPECILTRRRCRHLLMQTCHEAWRCAKSKTRVRLRNRSLVIARKINVELGRIMWQVSANSGSALWIRATVRQSGTVPLRHDFSFRELAISVLRKTNVIRPKPTLHRNREAQRSGVNIHFWHRIHNVQSTATHFAVPREFFGVLHRTH